MAKEVQKSCRFQTSNTIPAWRTIFSKSNPNTYNKFQTASNLTGRSPNSLKPRFIHQNQTLNPFEPLQKARTSNLFGQKWAEPRPKYPGKLTFEPFQTQVHLPKLNYEPSKNPELWTHELGLTLVWPNTIIAWLGKKLSRAANYILQDLFEYFTTGSFGLLLV